MDKFRETVLKCDIVVNKICTVHYFEYSKNYAFHGEKHNFWELVYVDKGEITAVAEQERFVLKAGDIIFHKPNEWHNLYANGEIAPNLVIVTFSSKSPAMAFFENKKCKVGQREKSIFSEIINEYQRAFVTPLDDTFTTHLTRRKESVFGSEQMIKIYLEQMLISMVRGGDIPGRTLSRNNNVNANLNLLTGYMANHISKDITLEELAHFAGISKSSVSQIFRENTGCGAVEYFIKMKISAAKKYIRENNLNFTQISQVLGYSGIHYFSRQFKKVTGMSPMEYSKSVKALVEEVEKHRDNM